MDDLLSGAAVLNDLTQYLSDTRARPERNEVLMQLFCFRSSLDCLMWPAVLFNLFKRAALNALLIVTSFPP